MRNLVKRALVSGGYEVVGEATNGREAVSLYFSVRPDFVTMDIDMPIMDGIEATTEILSKDKNALILAVSSHEEMGEKERRIIEIGAVGYLKKPFQPAFLWSRLEDIADKYKREGEIPRHKEDISLGSSTPPTPPTPTVPTINETEQAKNAAPKPGWLDSLKNRFK
jgi:two-component system chemotaxis response regulator CheY